MEQITITREEFRRRITNNHKGFGVVRKMRADPPEEKRGHELAVAMEEIALMLAISDIEEELFGEEEKDLKEAPQSV